MAVHEWRDRRGKSRVYVSKRWPDGRRFKRVVPTRTAGKKLLARIEESIAMGTWRDLRVRLDRPEENPTLAEFKPIYLKWCRAHNRRPDFKEEKLVSLVGILGKVPLRELGRDQAHRYVSRRIASVSPATVNRGIAVLRHLLSVAVELGYLDHNPLRKFPRLPETQRALRIPTLEEVDRLIESAWRREPVIGAYLQVLAETGMRKREALELRWSQVDLVKRTVILEKTKSGRVRTLPLTSRAVEAFLTLPRSVKQNWVFVRDLVTGARWKEMRETLKLAGKDAGVAIGLHDLRHFRATQWLRHGVDIRTVQELLGHTSITTTQRYLHYVEGHAATAIRDVEKIEQRGRIWDDRKQEGG